MSDFNEKEQLNISESLDESVAASETTESAQACEPAQPKTRPTPAAQQFDDRAIAEPTRKNGWLSNLFFVVVLVLSLFLMYQLSISATDGNEKTLAEILKHIRVEYLCAAICALLLMILLDSAKYFLILHATVGKLSLRMAMKTSLLGKYYDYITPFSSGGQPFQIHYLYKKGLTGGESTAVIFIKYCFNMLMWLTICFFLMILNKGALATYVADASQRKLFTIFGWVGFSVNCALPFLIIAFAVFPRIMETLVGWLLTIGHKLRIVKDKDSVVLKAKRISKDFRSAFAVMVRRPLHALGLAVCCICEPFLGMVLPYLVVVALGGAAVVPSSELMFAIMTLNVYVSMSVTIVPTPGNSGAMENAFLLTLTSVAEGVLFWTVFTWRFLSYYTFVIIGLFMLIADFTRKKRIARKNP